MEWVAFTEVDGPFGEQRADIRSAANSLPAANAFRSQNRAFTVADLMIRFGDNVKASKPKDQLEQKCYLIGLTAAMGGKVIGVLESDGAA